MKQSAGLKEMVTTGQIKVLTVYPDEDIALWRNRLDEMDTAWIIAYDKEQLLTLEQRYDLSSLPSFYLLDKDMKVLLKDADWRQVMYYFENPPQKKNMGGLCSRTVRPSNNCLLLFSIYINLFNQSLIITSMYLLSQSSILTFSRYRFLPVKVML